MDSPTTSTIAPNIPNKLSDDYGTVNSSNVNQKQIGQKTHLTAESYDKNDLVTQLADHRKEKEINYEISYGEKTLLDNKLSASLLENNELNNKLLQLNDTLKQINQNKDQTLAHYSEIKKYRKNLDKSLETSFDSHQVNLEKNLTTLESKIKDIIDENNNTKDEIQRIIENLQLEISLKTQQYSNISLQLKNKIDENDENEKIIRELIALKQEQAEKLIAIENKYRLDSMNKQYEVRILQKIIFEDLDGSADLLKTLTVISKFDEDNVPDDLIEKRRRFCRNNYNKIQTIVIDDLIKRFDDVALASPNIQFSHRYFCNKKISYYDSKICGFLSENLQIYEINLSLRNLAVIPEDIFTGLENVETIRLSFNRLYWLESGTFNNLLNLKTLNIQNNHLTSLPKDIFIGLKNLENLNLSDNRLYYLESGTFNNLSNLQRLTVDNNNLTALSSDIFNGLKDLTCLILSCSKLKFLEPGIFEDLSSLQKLDISVNYLTALSSDIFNGLEKLEELNLSSNKLNSLQPDTFNNLLNLKTLHIQDNDLTTLPKNIFTGLENLQYLNIASNRLNYLDPDIFRNLAVLYHVNIKENNLTTDSINTLKNMYNFLNV